MIIVNVMDVEIMAALSPVVLLRGIALGILAMILVALEDHRFPDVEEIHGVAARDGCFKRSDFLPGVFAIEEICYISLADSLADKSNDDLKVRRSENRMVVLSIRRDLLHFSKHLELGGTEHFAL